MMVITLAPIAAFLTHEMIRKYFPGENILRIFFLAAFLGHLILCICFAIY